jgi:hypothetical protein
LYSLYSTNKEIAGVVFSGAQIQSSFLPMSSRQLRKRLNERLELTTTLSDSEEETKQPIRNAFAVFELEEQDLQSSTEEEEELVITQLLNKKSKRKNNIKPNNDDDEIDRALKEIETERKSVPQHSSVKENNIVLTPAIVSSLYVDSRLLDGDAELRKKFGSRVIDSEIIRGRNTKIKRYILIQPKADWPPCNGGPSMTLISKNEGLAYFSLNHSKNYQAVQSEFYALVETHNPDHIIQLCRNNPYHIDSLLQISRIYKHNGDNNLACEFGERAIYGKLC